MSKNNLACLVIFLVLLNPVGLANELGHGFYYYDDKAMPKKIHRPLKHNSSPNISTFSRADWLEKNHKKILHQALDDPSEHNVLKALFINKLMQDKTTRYTDVAKSLIQTNPFLDESSRRPLSSFGAKFADEKAAHAKEQLLHALANKVGIYFFFVSTCPACHRAAPLLKSFASRYDITVKAISIDGPPLQSGLFKDYSTNQGQAEKLGITNVPSLVLFSPPDHFALIAQGTLLSQDELSERIINAGL